MDIFTRFFVWLWSFFARWWTGAAAFRPGFPHPRPTVSYWQVPEDPLARHRDRRGLRPGPDDGDVFDYVVVGSGVSGAATALKLLTRNPKLSVLMLEARTAASGASGRNGGHCRAGWWLYFAAHTETVGEEEAVKFERLEEMNVQDIADFVKDHEVDCDFRDVETVDVFTTEEGWKWVNSLIRHRERIRRGTPGDTGPMTKRTLWVGEEAEKRIGMPGIVGAVTYKAHTQNPYKLVCKMLHLAVDKGLNLQTNTPALAVREASRTSLSDDAGPRWEIETDRGTVLARNVVLATNAYTNALHPGLAGTKFLTPARSQVSAIPPGSAIDPSYLARSGGVVDVGTGDYFIRSSQNHIVWGGARSLSSHSEVGHTDDSVVNPKIAAYLHHAPPRFYGRDGWGQERDAVRDWTGITAYTPDTFPLVGEAPGQRGLWMTVGMNGHGMAMAFRCAEALVQMMAVGREPDWFPKSLRLSRAWEQEGEVEQPDLRTR